MTQPYFSVGEEVVLVSKESPELNGEYVIESIITDWEFDPGYDLEGITLDEGPGTNVHWAQEALRKKHKPSDKSFSELMDTANTMEGVR